MSKTNFFLHRLEYSFETARQEIEFKEIIGIVHREYAHVIYTLYENDDNAKIMINFHMDQLRFFYKKIESYNDLINIIQEIDIHVKRYRSEYNGKLEKKLIKKVKKYSKTVNKKYHNLDTNSKIELIFKEKIEYDEEIYVRNKFFGNITNSISKYL